MAVEGSDHDKTIYNSHQDNWFLCHNDIRRGLGKCNRRAAGRTTPSVREARSGWSAARHEFAGQSLPKSVRLSILPARPWPSAWSRTRILLFHHSVCAELVKKSPRETRGFLHKLSRLSNSRTYPIPLANHWHYVCSPALLRFPSSLDSRHAPSKFRVFLQVLRPKREKDVGAKGI
jgi:hypothetical protein